MTGRPRRHAGVSVSREEHLAWLALTEISGPFLTVPVLSRVWPTLEALDKPTRQALSIAHLGGEDDPAVWIDWILSGLLQWGDALDRAPNIRLAVAEHDAEVAASFALRDPATNIPVLLGMVTPPGRLPTARVPDDNWPATPADRLALLCRSQDIPLGLVTDGRWWALVWAPRGGVTTTAVFDSITWREAADRVVVRAFKSMLERRRFFGVPDDQRLPALLIESGDNQEEVTEQLGVQVRQAVELLVQAIGRDEQRTVDAGGNGLDATASEVYTAAVTVMMRIVFLLYAEERRLLPSDNAVYQTAYSAARLGEQLQKRADEAGEESLQSSYTGWYRLLALFNAVYSGIDHPRLTLHAYDGSIFDPTAHAWLPDVRVDDQAVLHMLGAVQRVTINRETRTLSFRNLDVEQIGYVYEGLLSFDAYRADDVVVGLVGKIGLEEEVRLADLETMWDESADDDTFAAELAATYKSSGIGTARAIAKRLVPPKPAEESAARGRLAAVTAGDIDLVNRLLDFQGLLRDDLRGLPVVIRPGALYVTASGLRASTGTHYTPRFLAEQVVEGALEPLIYSPGPLQTSDKNEWQPRTSIEILALNVADIAMGSGAFLVAACRYLAIALVEAWAREGDPRAAAATTTAAETGVIDTEVDPVVTEARRQIIEHCLYGVDINPMAVEMAKLSLWLVSMDPRRPFTFLDDRLLAGDSLLGISSLEQLEAMHLVPARGREIHQHGLVDFTAHIRARVQLAAKNREHLADMTGESLGELAYKREFLRSVTENTRDLMLNADLLVAASLASSGKGAESLDTGSKLAVAAIQRGAMGAESDSSNEHLRHWLGIGPPMGSFARVALHWPLVFPEVFLEGGFDSIIGNPPFLGGTMISTSNGVGYRKYIAEAIVGADTDRADLCVFFRRRAASLSRTGGSVSLIETQGASAGASRLHGYKWLIDHGWSIYSATSRYKWPVGKVGVFVVIAWMANQGRLAADPLLDGQRVDEITSNLTAGSGFTPEAHRLIENAGRCLQGSKPSGKGFVIDPAVADRLIASNPANALVVHPYLTGDDINSTIGSTATRWIIDFKDWPIERAAEFVEPFAIVSQLVRPIRSQIGGRKGKLWWQFEHPARQLYDKINTLNQVIVIAETSSTMQPALVSSKQVFSNTAVVVLSDSHRLLAIVSSAVHYWWSIERGTAFKSDARYQPRRCFETFPFIEPERVDDALGVELATTREIVSLERNIGLTGVYRLVHTPEITDRSVTSLRDVHQRIDASMCVDYGWKDLLRAGLDYGFHETPQGFRYTLGPVVRQEILDRLLKVNHERYAAEQASGAGSKKRATRRTEQAELFG